MKNDKIKVSIILPSLNVKDYIEECLVSVKNQSLKEIEIICVDAGSNDGTLEIIEAFSKEDSRIILLMSEKKSYGYQMNMGIKAARGEYIGIVETDDYVPYNMFEELYTIASENCLDYIKSDYVGFWEKEGIYQEKTKKTFANDELYNVILNPSEDPRIISDAKTIANWSGIYRTAFIKEKEIWHNETPGAAYQDTAFFLQVNVCAERTMNVDKAYYRYRRDNPNSSTNNPEKAFAIIKEYEFAEEQVKKKCGERWEKFCYGFNKRKLVSYLWMTKRISYNILADFVVAISEEFIRAEKAGEIDTSILSDKQNKQLELLINEPSKFIDGKIKNKKKKKKANIVVRFYRKMRRMARRK